MYRATTTATFILELQLAENALALVLMQMRQVLVVVMTVQV